jgi:D-aspartate ligase
VLTNLAESEGLHNWLILATGDSAVCTLCKNKSSLELHYRLPIPHWDVIKYAYNKKCTYELAEQLGIQIPHTVYPESRDDAMRVARHIQFPCILKPAVMHRLYDATGNKVVKVLRKDDLAGSYERFIQSVPPSEVMIQEIIGGVPDGLYSFGSFISNQHVSYVVANRRRQIPMEFGKGSTFVQSANISELKDVSLRFLKRIGYYGFSEVEFIKDPRDEKYKLLEVNPRSWKWVTIMNQSRATWMPMLFNGRYGPGGMQEPDNDSAGDDAIAKWIHFWQDLFVSVKEMIKGNMRVGEYVTTLKGVTEFAVASRDDPLPFLVEPCIYVWNKLRSAMRGLLT